MRKSMLFVVAVVAVVALGVSGCATKTYVQEQVAEASRASDVKIGEVQKQVEAAQMDIANLKEADAEQSAQIARLSETAQEALTRAQEAGKLAQGKLLYEVTLTDEAVKFGFDRADLSTEAKAALDAFAARLKEENQNVFLEIQGHTDSIGSARYNMTLGQNRAEAALRYLNTQHGIPLHRMSAISYGQSKPVADNRNAQGRAQNRRVTLVVLQ
jgi:peptidoglycan-associated lipoprotein